MKFNNKHRNSIISTEISFWKGSTATLKLVCLKNNSDTFVIGSVVTDGEMEQPIVQLDQLFNILIKKKDTVRREETLILIFIL